MNILFKIKDYIYKYREKFGYEPKVLKISKEEKEKIYSELSQLLMYSTTSSDFKECIMGFPITETPYAELARARVFSIPINEFISETYTNKFEAQIIFKSYEAEMNNILVQQLRAFILTDTTYLKVKIECDPWKWLKNILCLTKKFPIQIKEVNIKGQILYPYLKVQLPNHIHTVKLKLEGK